MFSLVPMMFSSRMFDMIVCPFIIRFLYQNVPQSMVLLLRVSVPARVASVPVVGSVMLVLFVVVRVSVCAPECVNDPAVLMFPPSVMVYAPLFTPVPPYVEPTRLPCHVLPVESVLLVSVSVRARVARVLVVVGRVTVAEPEFVRMLAMVGVVRVLLVSVSVPARVASVPVAGRVTLEPLAFAVSVMFAVLIVSVLPALFTPVPP